MFSGEQLTCGIAQGHAIDTREGSRTKVGESLLLIEATRPEILRIRTNNKSQTENAWASWKKRGPILCIATILQSAGSGWMQRTCLSCDQCIAK